MRFFASILSIMLPLCLLAEAASAAPPPLVEDGESFPDYQTLIANISRQDIIKAVAFSPDGATLAVGAWDNPVISLWDVASGREIQRLYGHTAGITDVGYAADGKRLLSTSRDKSLRLWDLASGAALRQMDTGGRVHLMSAAVSPDGARLAAGGDGVVYLLDAAGGAVERLEGLTGYVTALAFGLNGATLAVGLGPKQPEIRLFDLQTLQETKRLRGHYGALRALMFPADGNTLISAADDTSIRIWNLITGVESRILENHDGAVRALALAPDGFTLLSGSTDKTLRLWDVATGSELGRIEAHAHAILDVAFSPDGLLFASASRDGSLRLWDAASASPIRSLSGHRHGVHALAFSPDSATLAIGGRDPSIRLLDVASGRERRRLDGHQNWVRALAFAPDGDLLASASDDRTARLWNPVNGTEVNRMEGHEGWIFALAFTPTGKTLATGAWDDTISFWDVGTGEEITRIGDHTRVRSIGFGPTGRLLASGDDAHNIRLWDIVKGEVIRDFKRIDSVASVAALAFRPNSTAVAAGGAWLDNTTQLRDYSIGLWDYASGEEITRLRGHGERVHALAFSPDGKLLASGAGALTGPSDDDSLRIWDLEYGWQRAQLNDHSDAVLAVAFSPDGRWLASASLDGSVQLRRADTLALAWTYLAGNRDTWLSCKSDGRCWRHDDGSLLVKADAAGKLAPVAIGQTASADLDIIAAPAALEIASGEQREFAVEIKNNGPGPAFWVNLIQARKSRSALAFRAPQPLAVLAPGETAAFTVAAGAFRPAAEGSHVLELDLTHTGDSLLELAIPVTVRAPLFTLAHASIADEDGIWLRVLLDNTGDQGVDEVRVTARLSDSAVRLTPVIGHGIAPQGTLAAAFALPSATTIGPATRLNLEVRTTRHPLRVWRFDDQTLEPPPPRWPLYAAAAAFILIAAAITLLLRRRRRRF